MRRLGLSEDDRLSKAADWSTVSETTSEQSVYCLPAEAMIRRIGRMQMTQSLPQT